MAFRSFEAELVAVSLDDRLDVDELERRLGEAFAEAPLRDPGLPEPGRGHPGARASVGARRARAPLRLPRSRTSPIASSGSTTTSRRAFGAPRRCRCPGGHDVEDVLPRWRLGWRSARRRCRRSSRRPSRTPTSARARSATALRGVRQARLDRRAARAVAGALPPEVRADAGRPRNGPCRKARTTQPHGGFFSWLTPPAGRDAAALAQRAAEHGVGIVPGVRSSRTAAAAKRAPVVQHGRRGSHRRRMERLGSLV